MFLLNVWLNLILFVGMLGGVSVMVVGFVVIVKCL